MNKPQAIIDIGSNSVRLVVYDGPARAPAVLFNEKVSAGLGRGLGDGGKLDPQAVTQGLRALERFAAITRAMEIERVLTVATAAVRDASDGTAFLKQVAAMGLPVELLSGDQEARASGYGVVAAFPEADGIVGDLGGGSLELVRIRDGEVHGRTSLPLGVLRLADLKKGRGALERRVRKLLKQSGVDKFDRAKPFYMVGGSWRALARLHMELTDWPLPVLHGYAMPPEAASRLVRAISRMDRKRLKSIPSMPGNRVASLGDASALLAMLTRAFESSALVVSAFGLREGLMYEGLSPRERAKDPLIEAAQMAGAMLGRFPEHGDLLAGWIAPLFAGEDARCVRLRRTACLLGDVGWMANPELRAERGLDIALYGNWIGIDAAGRALVAHALYTSFGGNGVAQRVAALLSPDELEMAARWGLAMRLGQRLSGGVARPLELSRLSLTNGALALHLPSDAINLYGETVERRHRQLADALGAKAALA